MLSKPTKKDVADAILTYSPDRLQQLICDGYQLSLPMFDDAIYSIDHTSDIEIPSEKIFALSSHSRASTTAFPLHLAVVCVYQAALEGNYTNKYAITKALETIDIILENDQMAWRRGCGDIIVPTKCVDIYFFNHPYPENLPLHLALHLKQFEKMNSNISMDRVIKGLQKASNEVKKKISPVETTPVIKCVAGCYKNMLFSEEFSDITFQCSDGISIPSHKLILAGSSPYFRAAFQGDWAENNSEGVWVTAHDSKLIKSVLTLIYTGSVEECGKLLSDKGTDPIGLLEMAYEYDIKPLIFISVDNCINKLEVSNVKQMLQVAHVHSSKKLKKACFEFSQKNTSKVLMDPGMMDLATEDPSLWAELGGFLNGTSSKPTKRARIEK